MMALLAVVAAPVGSALAQAEAAPLARALAQAEAAPGDSDRAPPSASAALPDSVAPPAPPPASAPVAFPVESDGQPETAAERRGLLLLPYLGMNVPVGDIAQRYAPGMRFGLLAGWHLGQRFSLDGEATLDFMDAEEDPSFLRPREHMVDLALSPLIHLRSGTIVAGPKLGWFNNRRRYPADAAGNRPAGHHGQGLVVGLNLGGFADVGGIRLGMLASVVFRRYLSSGCDTGACGGLLDPILLGISVAALFSGRSTREHAAANRRAHSVRSPGG